MIRSQALRRAFLHRDSCRVFRRRQKRQGSRGVRLTSTCSSLGALNQRMTTPSMATPAAVPLATMSIVLTEKEQRLRNLLLDVAKYINESKQIKERLELRFAGGWVRDKLLGIASHDIDTAINAMTGDAFARTMQEFLKDPIHLARHGTVEDFGSLHKILANPEKSKHLETATTRIFDLDVDFVNLRSEVYTDDSRNPQMEFGTAVEDALRRDATINALFYNLHTDSIEDFTTGLKDLESKIIRTPLEPRKTFFDDPLRILRLIRFASRLGFAIDPKSEEYMNDPAILESLRVKISRERVGVEVEKMMKDRHPRDALKLFDRLGLFATVFSDPQSSKASTIDTQCWRYAYDCLEALQSDTSPTSLYNRLAGTQEERFYSWLLAAVAPWSSVEMPEMKAGKQATSDVTFVIREGLKLSSKTSDFVTAAFKNRKEITVWMQAINSGAPEASRRGQLGMTIRRWEGRDLHWRTQVIFAILVEAMRNRVTDYSTLFQRWENLLDHLESLDLLDAHLLKRIIDGKELAAALDAPPGKWMSTALDICLEWQFRNPNAVDPQGAIEEVRNRRDELQIPAKKVKVDMK